jgi:hypothetical protein
MCSEQPSRTLKTEALRLHLQQVCETSEPQFDVLEVHYLAIGSYADGRVHYISDLCENGG